MEFHHQPGDTIRINASYVKHLMDGTEDEKLQEQTLYDLSNLNRWDCKVEDVGELDWRTRGLFSPTPSIYWIRLMPDFPVINNEKAVTLYFHDLNIMKNCFFRIKRPGV